ncbi:hypothetical protein CCYA_CCYA01G0356 [Cyanidiococcus yangmingshanensis]|nr:hypothetical protein CCYA_CCYA01G0356 [Cyanidiococcus yangmingshanensis]
MQVLWRGWRTLSNGAVTPRPPKQPPPLGSAVFRPPRQPASSTESETAETASSEDVSFEMVDRCNPDAPMGPEYDGPQGYEPTRYGDWSKNGRVSDF